MREFTYKSIGALNKKEVGLKFRPEGEGVFFEGGGERFEAVTDNILNTQRNTVLGRGKYTLCFVEHLLAVVHLCCIRNLSIEVDSREIPLEDGSGLKWFELFREYGHVIGEMPGAIYEITEPLHISQGHKQVVAIPNDKFKMTYLFQDPVSKQKNWVTWSKGDDIELLVRARTFAPLAENKLMGLNGVVLGYDSQGFDQPLRMEYEPAYHKLLDLFGDLSLMGVNPYQVNGHFISMQGSHATNAQMAALLREKFNLEGQ